MCHAAPAPPPPPLLRLRFAAKITRHTALASPLTDRLVFVLFWGAHSGQRTCGFARITASTATLLLATALCSYSHAEAVRTAHLLDSALPSEPTPHSLPTFKCPSEEVGLSARCALRTRARLASTNPLHVSSLLALVRPTTGSAGQINARTRVSHGRESFCGIA